MLHTLDGLRRLALGTRDMDAGLVRDVLFDDHDWTIRYVVANAGQWLFGKRVLIPPEALGEPQGGRIPLRMTLQELRERPEIDEGPPSKLREVAMRHHVGWPAYWKKALDDEGVPNAPAGDGTLVTGPAAGPPDATAEAELLYGARELEGVAVQGADGAGDVGTLADVVVDLPSRRIAAWVVLRRDGTPAAVPVSQTRALDRVGRRMTLAEPAAAVDARPAADILPDGTVRAA